MALGDIYNVGTVSVANGSAAVTGTGVLWADVEVGDTFWSLGGIAVEVSAVDPDLTHLTLQIPWPGTTLSGAAYYIRKDSWLRYSPAEEQKGVRKFLTDIKGAGLVFYVTTTVPDPSFGEEGQYARNAATGQEWLKTGGAWVYQGTFGPFTVSDTVWSAATTYAQRIIVSRNGKLWLSLQAGNLNHVPESSPTWWLLFLAGGDRYDIAIFDTDRPASGEEITKWVAPSTTTFRATLIESQAKADVAATASSVFSLKKNGVQFATLTFGAASATGVFACAADAVFAAGDVLTVIAPNPRDATLSGVAATIVGYR